MDVSERMKYKLANAMKELLVHTPVDKITVKQIVDQCNVTRPTFYRHFKDKYDLINWYFDVLAQLIRSYLSLKCGKNGRSITDLRLFHCNLICWRMHQQHC